MVTWPPGLSLQKPNICFQEHPFEPEWHSGQGFRLWPLPLAVCLGGGAQQHLCRPACQMDGARGADAQTGQTAGHLTRQMNLTSNGVFLSVR